MTSPLPCLAYDTRDETEFRHEGKAMAVDSDRTLAELCWALLNAKEFTFNH